MHCGLVCFASYSDIKETLQLFPFFILETFDFVRLLTVCLHVCVFCSDKTSLVNNNVPDTAPFTASSASVEGNDAAPKFSWQAC